MTRMPHLDETALTAKQQQVFDTIVSGPRKQVVGPLRVWMQSPALAERAQALGQYARYDSVLPEKLSELAILVTARVWSSGFEWAHHAPIALAAGVPQHVVEAISLGQRVTCDDPDMQAVLDFSIELHRDRRVSDRAYTSAHTALGQQGCVDLVGICGYYTLISMTINTFEVPDGEGPILPTLNGAHDMFRD